MGCGCREGGGDGVGGGEAGDGPEDYAILVVAFGKDEVVKECHTSLRLVRGESGGRR